MSQIQEAIEVYHTLLTDNSTFAAQIDHDMRLLLREKNLYFGDRPLCISLRPHFYFRQDWLFLKQQQEKLLGAFARAHEICMTSPEHRAQLMLDPHEEELLALDADSAVPWSSSRLDNFFVVESKTLKCVEYNAETPAGIGYGDNLNDVFMNLEVMRRFQEHYHVEPMPAMGDLLGAILQAYADWGGVEKPAQIAILDWREVPTLNEHEICREYFEANGVPAILADPRELEFRENKLYCGDFRIDIVYKRVLFSELFNVLGTDNALIRAMRERSALITNSLSAKLLAKKASLAFLSDERNRDLFTADQQEAIEAHIPWTRVVEERKTIHDGAAIDLLPYVAQHKDKFVLKPNDEYGGRGVVIGWECSDDGWSAALEQAAKTPHVVQERVQVVMRPFPAWIDGHLNISSLFVDADPYVFYGKNIYGCLTRLSPVALLNVTAGMGSVVPTLLIEKK